MKHNIQNLTITAFMSAIICIMGPVVFPIGMVPMSLANLAIYLTILLLDKKKATLSVGIYLLIGIVGLPVFSGFTGGAGKVFGPTGGYLIGYLILSWISGSILEKWTEGKGKKGNFSKRKEKNSSGKGKIRKKDRFRVWKQFIALMTGNLCLYAVGTMWLMLQSEMDIFKALTIGVFPFVVFDIFKIFLALMVGSSVKKRLGNEKIFR